MEAKSAFLTKSLETKSITRKSEFQVIDDSFWCSRGLELRVCSYGSMLSGQKRDVASGKAAFTGGPTSCMGRARAAALRVRLGITPMSVGFLSPDPNRAV